MNKRIRNGAWCLFRRPGAGTRQGKVVLAEYTDLFDTDHGGKYTVKLYHSTKEATPDGEWQHATVTLKPDSYASTYRDIPIPADKADRFRIIGELVAVFDV